MNTIDSASPHTTESTSSNTLRLSLSPADTHRLALLCGQCDDNLRLIEQRLGVRIHNRGHDFWISGTRASIARGLLASLYDETLHLNDLPPASVHLALQEASLDEYAQSSNTRAADSTRVQHEPPNASYSSNESHRMPLNEPSASAPTPYETASQTTEAPIGIAGTAVIRTKKCSIKPRGGNQQKYVQSVRLNDLNFGIGPAGTGKTYLAVACAVESLIKDEIERILLVRPAVEAGEKLGFLPGDLSQKVDPYLRPLYDALFEMLGFEYVEKLIERNVIEVAPLAYMRGRTLNNSFVILDESQNTTREQMKMFLTRIGFGSTAVINGDPSQIDLPRSQASGLKHAIEVLDGVEGISFTYFGAKDVVRHPLVQRIVEAYDRADDAAQSEANP